MNAESKPAPNETLDALRELAEKWRVNSKKWREIVPTEYSQGLQEAACGAANELDNLVETLKQHALASEAAALTGYELAGCADRAKVLVRLENPQGLMAADWERFAKEIRTLLASPSGQPALAALPESAPSTPLSKRGLATEFEQEYPWGGIRMPVDPVV